MTTKKNLIAEAHEHLDKAADAAPVSARQAILTGKVEDQRLSLVARLAHALERVTAERDEAREAAENNVLNAEAVYERMGEKLRSVTAERDEALKEADRSAQERGRLIEERDQLAAVIREALGVARSGSVPLGVQEARHFDRLLAETRRALNEAPSVALDRVKAEAWEEGVARAETCGVEAAFDENPYRKGEGNDQ